MTATNIHGFKEYKAPAECLAHSRSWTRGKSYSSFASQLCILYNLLDLWVVLSSLKSPWSLWNLGQCFRVLPNVLVLQMNRFFLCFSSFSGSANFYFILHCCLFSPSFFECVPFISAELASPIILITQLRLACNCGVKYIHWLGSKSGNVQKTPSLRRGENLIWFLISSSLCPSSAFPCIKILRAIFFPLFSFLLPCFILSACGRLRTRDVWWKSLSLTGWKQESNIGMGKTEEPAADCCPLPGILQLQSNLSVYFSFKKWSHLRVVYCPLPRLCLSYAQCLFSFCFSPLPLF